MCKLFSTLKASASLGGQWSICSALTLLIVITYEVNQCYKTQAFILCREDVGILFVSTCLICRNVTKPKPRHTCNQEKAGKLN